MSMPDRTFFAGGTLGRVMSRETARILVGLVYFQWADFMVNLPVRRRDGVVSEQRRRGGQAKGKVLWFKSCDLNQPKHRDSDKIELN